MNHNQILNVSPDASASEIQTAFRKAALETHPDHSNSPEAAEAFARIKEARDELMKRAETNSHTNEGITSSTTAAVKATTNAAYSHSTVTDLYDGFTPAEIAYIQSLDAAAAQKPKSSLFHRTKESHEIKQHRKKLKTNERRLRGLY